ncbi:MAG: cytochrome c [bacterium]|nr:cytochrome c [bacterium]
MRKSLAMALLLGSTAAQAQSLPGDTASGRNLALRICSDCHVVAEGQTRPATDGAPPFATAARDPAVTPLSLRVFLQSPHKNMPNLILRPSEIDDLVSYILSLKR